MKKTLLIMVMALALLLTQCRKPEVKFPSPVAPEGTTVSMTVTAGPGSKTDISTAGDITWSTGDKLYVGDGTKYVGYLTLQGAGGSATGTFSGDVTLTGITEGVAQTFHFYYLGSTTVPAVDATTVDVDFSSQNIYADVNNKLVNASAQHVGYGSANGTVKDGVVTGINVTLVSKVALARFSFKKGDAAYDGALTLSGDGIYNKMTVNFASSTGFSFSGTEGSISLTGSHAERYVMLVPTGATEAQSLTFTGSSESGTGDVPGLQANKFYGKTDAIAVTLTAPAPTHETVNFGTPNLNWSVCNLGATNGETAASWYGDYYAWGATETWYSAGGRTSSPTWKPDYSDGYTWAYCPHTNGTYSDPDNKAVFTKYIPEGMNDYWAGDGNPDNKLVLESSDDAATVAWGSGWRMPTSAEWHDLYDYNTFEWLNANMTSENVPSFKAVAPGYLVVKGKEASLDASVYMFPSGCRQPPGTNLIGFQTGSYWSSSLSSTGPTSATSVSITVMWVHPDAYSGRGTGLPVRPVR